MDARYYALKDGMRPAYFEKLCDIAAGIDLIIEHKAMRRVRGWPAPSQKPWSLRYRGGELLCAFRSLDQLERNLRGRAGC
jgi:hypothetical protein